MGEGTDCGKLQRALYTFTHTKTSINVDLMPLGVVFVGERRECCINDSRRTRIKQNKKHVFQVEDFNGKFD
jgi:hypothetical protein